jgi:hypothetical protein
MIGCQSSSQDSMSGVECRVNYQCGIKSQSNLESMMMPRCSLSQSPPTQVRRGQRSDRHHHRDVVMLMVDGRWYQEDSVRMVVIESIQ